MLAAVGHAGLQQAVHQALGQQRHHARVAVEGAVADHARRAHGRDRAPGVKLKVHAAGAQLAAQHEAAGVAALVAAIAPLPAGPACRHPQLAQRAWAAGG
jgi:hypothetical protein